MIIKRCFLLLFILLITLGSSKAQWQKLSFEGGISKNIVQTDSFLFMLNTQGIYKSSKSNIYWQKVNSSAFQNAVTFNSSDPTQILSDSNKIYLVHNANSSYLFESADQGLTWQNISPNKNHGVTNLFRLNGILHLATRTKLNTNADTTIFYKRINQTWNIVSIFNAALRVQISKDTLYINNLSVFPSTWHYSINAINLQSIVTNDFWNTLTKITRVNHKYYAVKNNEQLLSSADGRSWQTIPGISFNDFINSYLVFENKIYVNYSKGFKNYIFYHDLNTNNYFKFEGLNTVFNGIQRVDSTLYFSTVNGVYSYHQNLQYKMKGINDAHIVRMFAMDSILYIESRDTVFRTLDKGLTWKAINEFSPQLGELKMYKFYGTVYASIKNNLYISKNNGLTFKTHEITFGAPSTIEILGYDSSAVYIRGNTSLGNVYLRTSDGITFNILLFQVFGASIFPSYVYEDNDTLFAFGNYANFKYYSLDFGNTWHGYPFLNLLEAQYFVAEMNNYLGRPFAYCMSSSLISTPDISVIRKNNKWQKIPMFETYFDLPIIYESENVMYIFKAKRLLQYSLDTFSTVQQYNIDFNVHDGFPINTFAMLGNRVVVSLPTAGMWYKNIEKPTVGIDNSLESKHALFYPNPTNSVVCIKKSELDSEMQNIEVYDLKGTKLMEINDAELLSSDNPCIDLSELQAQLYVIKITTLDKVYTAKCMLKK